MIVKNDRVIAEANHGARSPISIYHGEHLVFSKYVVLGTTYNSQSWTVTVNGETESLTVNIDVITIAGTDTGGDFYYFGVRNETFGLNSKQAIFSLITSIFSSVNASTNKIRTIDRCIPVGAVDNQCIYRINDSNIRRYATSENADTLITVLSNLFDGCENLEEIEGLQQQFANNLELPVRALAGTFNNCKKLRTIGNIFQGLLVSSGTDIRFLFDECRSMEDDIKIGTWLDSDGTSKPTLLCEGSFLSNFQLNVPAQSRTPLDLDGITFKVGNSQRGVRFANCYAPILNFSKIKLLPRDGDTDVTITGQYMLYNVNIGSVVSFADIAPKIVITNNTHMFGNNPTMTSLDIINVYAPSTAIVANTFNEQIFYGSSNITSLKTRAHNYNGYCVQAASGETQQLVHAVDFSMLAWNDATEIGDFIASLASDTCRQYAAYGNMVQVTFNAAQSATVRALANWATLSAQIAANGWNVQLL